MTHDGDACAQDATDAVDDLSTTLQFDGVRLGLLHDSNRGLQCQSGVALIGAEGEIDDDESSVHCTLDALSMVDHVLEGDGDGGDLTRHDVGRRIPDEDHVHACVVDQLRQ